MKKILNRLYSVFLYLLILLFSVILLFYAYDKLLFDLKPTDFGKDVSPLANFYHFVINKVRFQIDNPQWKLETEDRDNFGGGFLLMPFPYAATFCPVGEVPKNLSMTKPYVIRFAEIHGNAFDISILKGHQIEYLGMSNTVVKDLSALKGMNLGWLRIRKNQCNIDLSAIADMQLYDVDLTDTPIEDISILKGMPLRSLSLSGTKVTNISALKGMPLQYLNLKNTGISDISVLKGSLLNYLDLSGTKVTDLSPLKGLPIKTLYLNNTNIEDISVLERIPLEYLEIKNCKVKDFSSLKNSKLWDLALSGKQLKDISSLQRIRVFSLVLNNTGVSDFTPLKKMSISTLIINGSEVSDLSSFLRSGNE